MLSWKNVVFTGLIFIGFFVILPTTADSMHDVEHIFIITETFLPVGYMGDIDAVTVVDRFKEELDTNSTQNDCTKITYLPDKTIRNNNWAGVYWLYPVYPETNWGDLPGYNLSGYSHMTFRARGEKGGEIAEFKFGGIEEKEKPYHDSVIPAKTTGKITLQKEWSDYTFDLTENDLESVLGGFCWVTTESDNPEGCIVYIDDIILK